MDAYDVVIVGSGVAGSVTALLLSKLGHKTLMVEKDTHPRFALGESTTPIFSKKLRNLATAYDVPEFMQLSSYDRIRDSGDTMCCGPKELFHYFVHQPNQTQARLNGEIPEIIVQTPDVDTQFLRADLDERLVQYARKYGAHYVDMTQLLDVNFRDDGVDVKLQKRGEEPYDVKAKFFIDASGFRSLLAKKLDLRLPEDELDTPLRSRCIFTHFEGVGRLEDALPGDKDFADRLKIDRARATQHHCFDGGWYWFIPFGNGVTSVGLSLDMEKYPMNDIPGEEEFWQITNRFPIVKAMLEGRKTVLPYMKTARMQTRTRYAAGDRWALLPAAAVGMDAWFSTGMGLNLVNIHRLVETLHTNVLSKNDFKRKHLEQYESSLFKEWWHITRMMHGIYKSFKHYDVFKWYCFLCFMGAESFVHTGALKRPTDPSALVLNVGDANFFDGFKTVYAKVLECADKDEIDASDSEFIRNYLQNELKPYNYRDYGNPAYQGIHYRLDKSSPFYDMH